MSYYEIRHKMTQINALLELRTQIKNRKPNFIRQDNPKRMKLSDKWRKPKGIHSKIRHKFKGRRKMPSPGYKSPSKVRGLHAFGLKIINVSSADDVAGIKKESEGIVIQKSIGAKKRFEILKKAKELNVKVLNLNVDEHIKKIEEKIESKKKAEAKKEQPKEAKKEAPQQEPKKIEEDKSGESKKDSEKKDKDKVLTKKV